MLYETRRCYEKILAAICTIAVLVGVVKAKSGNTMGGTVKGAKATAADGAAGNPVNGTLLQGIAKTAITADINQRSAELTVYGRAYIETADGYAFGTDVKRNLQELAQAVDTVWSNLTDMQKQGMLDMYEIYQSVMTIWEIPNIKAK